LRAHRFAKPWRGYYYIRHDLVKATVVTLVESKDETNLVALATNEVA